MSGYTATWTYPTHRVDGSAVDPSIVITGTVEDAHGNAVGSATGGPGSAGSLSIASLPVGSGTYSVVFTDAQGGSKSAPSNIVTVDVLAAAFAAATDFAITANP